MLTFSNRNVMIELVINMKVEIVASTSERLAEAMARKNIKQSELARITGIDKSSISLYVSGKYSPKGDKLYKLSLALGVSPAWLSGFNAPMVENDVFNNLPDNIIPLPQTKTIPLLGTIACGEPILATENIEMYIKVDESIPADFALKCKGDSMINARIFDGDIVYIRQQPDVEDGEIAAVLIGDEATLKKVHKYPNKIVLSACNPMYDDYVYTNEQLNEIRILGKAVAFFSIIK